MSCYPLNNESKSVHTIAGKGNEDKRGIPVTHDVYSKSWLYVNGQPVVCNRHMEVRVAFHIHQEIIQFQFG